MSHCLQAAKIPLETFGDFDDAEIKSLSTVEWFRFISATVAVFSTIAAIHEGTAPDSLIRQQLSSFGPLLQSVYEKIEGLSCTRKGTKDPPDIFCLMAAVLGIVVKIFGNQLDNLAPSGRAGSMTRLSKLCPVLNGQIQGTDYWDIWRVFTASTEECSQSAGPR
jgi:hypothetical protein